ncbi:hypothetical protein K491DRAFT_723410 [Lophiostoma macrostomum CBS 122681]|uniref:Uncharacterized protein n=1 Tax=Lophiostoma macrostomum CBS 122681 TaxID=1314788 RepID=A0A6A6SM71_9PLEO|nr:hypothetical protein K491DRAFT_723410 [Lophiostoma macrostomum CBS 122681]
MLSSAHFTPGTILWLPKQADVDPSSALSAHHTVPEGCFGHSVLVLAEGTTNNCVTILILTSFGGGSKISRRVRKRGHSLAYYIPFHPARQLAEGSPTLHLRAPQEFDRHIWANARHPQQCPKHWLQKTWAHLWTQPGEGQERGRERIDDDSLHTLAAYGVQMGFDLGVYGALLRDHPVALSGLESPGRFGQPGPVLTDLGIPEEGYGARVYPRPDTAAAAVAPPPATNTSMSHVPENRRRYVPPVAIPVPAHVRLAIPRFEPSVLGLGPFEREPLLPQTNPNRDWLQTNRSWSHPPTHPLGAYGAVGRPSSLDGGVGGRAGAGANAGAKGPGAGSSALGLFIRVVLHAAVIAGVLWTGRQAYLRVCSLFVKCRRTIGRLAGAAWREIGEAGAQGSWSGIIKAEWRRIVEAGWGRLVEADALGKCIGVVGWGLQDIEEQVRVLGGRLMGRIGEVGSGRI